jgi:cyclic-di-GMP-binding protein
MPTFDVVSKVNWHEVDNALGQAVKEVSQRYDFKGSDTKIELVDKAFQIESSDDYKVNAAVEVLEGKLAKRGVSLKSLDKGKVEPAGGSRARQ